jgi:toxin ParE1/3/4
MATLRGMIVRYSRRASRDLVDTLAYLAERSPQGAMRVSSSLRGSIDVLIEQPFSGLRTTGEDLLVKIVPDYPYKIFYRVKDNAIEIVHIRHASRKPWTD